VSLAYRDACNYASNASFYQLNKSSSGTRIHDHVYRDIRSQYGLPSQIACSVSRNVAAKYKTQWTKLHKHVERQKLSKKKFRPYKGLDNPVHFVARTCAYQYGRDYRLLKNGKVSVNTLDGRIRLDYQTYNQHLEMLRDADNIYETKLGGADLYYEQKTKTYYLLVSFTVSVDEPIIEDYPEEQVVGMDTGQRCLAVLTNNNNQTKFYTGGKQKQKKDHFNRKRKELQSKGTRGSTRKLRAWEKRESRFIRDCNHRLSNEIHRQYPQSLLTLEELTGIRDRIEPRHSKKHSKKKRQDNRRRSQWSFADLHDKLEYKAHRYGSVTIKVIPDYTSQDCPECAHRSKDNRPNKGLLFKCQNNECDRELHSDLSASRNITMRGLFTRQAWVDMGHLSTVPNIADAEAKVELLNQYSKLRWSQATNHGQKPVGS
jgi:IS605 OrfB family transposase